MCLSQKSLSMTRAMSLCQGRTRITGNQPTEADENHQAEVEQSRSVVGTLYWHIDCQADHDICVELGSEVQAHDRCYSDLAER